MNMGHGNAMDPLNLFAKERPTEIEAGIDKN
jgi:hypothetical protein